MRIQGRRDTAAFAARGSGSRVKCSIILMSQHFVGETCPWAGGEEQTAWHIVHDRLRTSGNENRPALRSATTRRLASRTVQSVRTTAPIFLPASTPTSPTSV